MVVLLTRAPFPSGGYQPKSRPVRARGGAGARPAGLTSAPPVRQPITLCERAYARRRLAALLAAGLVVAALVVSLGMLRATAADGGVPEGTTVVQVRSGETLWDLAERVAPRAPAAAVVERIRQLNGMSGSTVHPGQPLVVPDGS